MENDKTKIDIDLVKNNSMSAIDKRLAYNTVAFEEIFKNKNDHTIKGYTHSGVFHADEVFATAILGLAFPVFEYERGFKPEESDADIIYDIGGGKFDHHQKGGNGCRENNIPYSSCGLIWKEYGILIAHSDNVWNKVDQYLIQSIDAIDNGISGTFKIDDNEIPVASISSVISSLNPTWDSCLASDDAFKYAVEIATTVLLNTLNKYASAERAINFVKEAYDKSDNGIIVLDQYLPWKDHLFNIENEDNKIYFVIFPGQRGGWNIQCVPESSDSFISRIPLPEELRGLPKEELSMLHKGLLFVHNSGFLGNCETKESALELAHKVLNNYK